MKLLPEVQRALAIRQNMKRILFILALLWGSVVHAAGMTHSAARGVHFEASAGTVGVASWYGDDHQGKIMANGEPFDSRALTAASRTLPLGSWIRVFNLRNGKSVDVQVTDRGPNKRLRDRILDLSKAAAKQLNFQRAGLTVVAFVPIAEPRSRQDWKR
jgi:rare lipoprotein A (peptidoglycan hydrolase)